MTPDFAYLLFEIILPIITEFVYFSFYFLVLKCRNVPLSLVAFFVFNLILVFQRPLGPVLQVAWLVLRYIAIPLLLFAGSRSRMLLTMAAAFVMEAIFELLASAIWVLITGAADYSVEATLANINAYITMRLIALMITFALMFYFASLIRRFTAENPDEELDGSRMKAIQFKYFAGLIATQALIFSALSMILAKGELSVSSPWAFGCSIGITLLFVGLDLSLLIFLGRHQEQLEADLAVQALQDRSNIAAQRSQALLSQVEIASRLRHDARNTVTVAREMQARGLADNAQQLLQQLQNEVQAATRK